MSTGLKWLRLVCMAVVFGIIAGGVMVGMNYLGGSMISEEEDIPQTNTVTLTADAGSTDDAVVAVAREAMPSVVTISTMSVEEMRSFFGGTQEIQVQGAGTGVIVNKNESELLIATNNHVVEGATQLSVGFVDQSSVEAQVKGTDVDNDLAVVAVQLSDIPAETLSQLKIATIGDSDELELGQPVVAICFSLARHLLQFQPTFQFEQKLRFRERDDFLHQLVEQIHVELPGDLRQGCQQILQLPQLVQGL